jgi:Bifunctional DNA primase/polymerase, N-terminal/Primase C terminal 1 (PriCT-1)
LVVLDTDPRHGGDDSLYELERQHGVLPPTRTVVTPGGGQHYYFRWPGFWIKNIAPIVPELPGLDMRGDGGYVVVPPSPGYEPDSVAPLAPMPPVLIELTRDDRNDRNGDRPRVPAGVWARMFVEGIPEGERNDDLTKVTGHLIRRYVDVDLAAALVHLANEAWCQRPLPGSEVDRIIDSVAGMELRRRERRSG